MKSIILLFLLSISAIAGTDCEIFLNQVLMAKYQRVDIGPMLSKPFVMKSFFRDGERSAKHRLSLRCDSTDEGLPVSTCFIALQNMEDTIQIGEMRVTKHVASTSFAVQTPEAVFTFGDSRAKEDVVQVICKNQ